LIDPPHQLQKPRRRFSNEFRTSQLDNDLLGKYIQLYHPQVITNDINFFLPETLYMQDTRQANPKLINQIRDLLHLEPTALAPPPLRFDTSSDNANYNFEVLSNHHFDLNQCWIDNPYSVCTPGSEFNPLDLLEPLFHLHPLWLSIRHYLHHGVPIHSKTEPHRQRQQHENDAMVECLNHKKARNNMQLLVKTVTKEVFQRLGVSPTIDSTPASTTLHL
jgi:hypothetical protein